MLGQLISSLNEFKTFIPWLSFIAGMGGSLHCVGMCGGLVTASCEKDKDIFRYQIGRLIGYLFLGLLGTALGSLFRIENLPPTFSLIPAILMGTVFIFWGVQNFRGQKSQLPASRRLRTLYTKLWTKLVFNNPGLSKAFFTGLISILLPCGLLYGVILGAMTLENKTMALISIFFFWLGTLPSMVFAPGVVRRILQPLKLKLPRVYALTVVLFGVLTISSRLAHIHAGENRPVTKASPHEETHKPHRCH